MLLVKRNVSLSPLIPFGNIRFAYRKTNIRAFTRYLSGKLIPFLYDKKGIKKVTTSEFRFTKLTCGDLKKTKPNRPIDLIFNQALFIYQYVCCHRY